MKRILLIPLFFLLLATSALGGGVNNILLCNVDSDTSFRPTGYCNSPVLTKISTTSTSVNIINGSSIDTENNIGYFTTSQTPSKVLKINLSTMAELGVATITGSITITSSAIDITNGFLYISVNTFTGGAIHQIRLSDLAIVKTLATAAGGAISISLDISNDYGYFILYAGPSDPKVYKVKLSDLTLTSTLMTTNAIGPYSSAIDTTNGFLYVSGRGASDRIVRISKISISTFTEISYLNTGVTEGITDFNATIIDVSGGYLYIGLDTPPPKFMKINLSTFTVDSTITSPVGNGLKYDQAGIDTTNGFVYFIDYGASTRLYRIKMLDNSYSDSLAISSGMNNALIVNPLIQYAYVGTFQSPANIIKVDICGD